jgi:transcriptional regulator with XRE-family HTH domain
MGKKQAKMSDQIRDAVSSSDVSRYRIALETGIEQSTLSRFMGGTGGMTVETLDKLGEYLGLEIVFKRKPKGSCK